MQIKDFNKYIGDTLDKEILSQYFSPNGSGYGEYKDCKEYIAYFYAISEHVDKREQLKVSVKRMDIWLKRNADLRLYIWIDQDFRILGLELKKYREIYAGHGRPVTEELDLIQDELRIINRLMDLNRSKSAL